MVLLKKRKRGNRNSKDLEAYQKAPSTTSTQRISIDTEFVLTGIEIGRKLGSGRFGEVFEGKEMVPCFILRNMEWNYSRGLQED